MDTGHWEDLSGSAPSVLPYGFVYRIINLKSEKKYIGKKQCLTTIKRPPLKGKINKRSKIQETDWKIYTSSCNDLNEDIKSFGKEIFKFQILRWCNSKAELAYYEAKMQLQEDVLIREDYYNGIINLRIPKFKIKPIQ